MNKPTYEELASQVEHLCYHITNIALCYDNNTGHEPSLSVFHRALDEAQESIEKTPQQCLAEMRADTIRQSAQRVLDAAKVPMGSSVRQDYFKAGVRCAAASLVQYAEQIRQGGAR